MTLTLSPEIMRVLTKAAEQQGRTPEELTVEAVREKYAVPEESHEEKKARIQALMGSMAYLGPSHIMEDGAEEVARKEREERRQEALARIRSGYYQSRLSSSEEFMARKAEEKALEESHEEKKARIYVLMGSSSDLGPNRLIQDKAEEIAREDRRL